MEWLDINKNTPPDNSDVLVWFSIDDGFWQKCYKSNGKWFNYLNEPLTEYQLKYMTHFSYVQPLKILSVA